MNRSPFGDRRRLVALFSVVSAVLTVVSVNTTAFAATSVTAVSGSAYGYLLRVGLFGGPPQGQGPSPSVTLPSSGGNVTATAASGYANSGPATFFSSGRLDVSTQGTTGPTGSVTSTTNIANINTSQSESLTATNLASTCTASGSAHSGSATVTGGVLQTDSGYDINGDGDFTDPGEHPPVDVAVPTNPAPNTSYDGHIHVNGSVDSFRYVFNEQVINPDGSFTVFTAHDYLLGPTAVGDLFVGKSQCGVTAIDLPVVTLSSSANPSVAQQALTLSANVSSGSGTATGTVSFLDGTTAIGEVPLSSSSAAMTTSLLSPGSHSLTARYNGDASHPVASSTPLSQQVNFTDVPNGAPFYADIYWLTNNKIAAGFTDGSFHPADGVTRQAFAAYLYRYAHSGVDAGSCPAGTSPFSDVPSASQFCGDIKWLADSGITTGFADGGFHPTSPVSRQSVAAFFYRFNHSGSDAGACAAGTSAFADVPDASPFCGDIKWLASTAPQPVTSGFSDGGFHPSVTVARQAVAAFFHRYNTDFG